jgi:hypothetical protein
MSQPDDWGCSALRTQLNQAHAAGVACPTWPPWVLLLQPLAVCVGEPSVHTCSPGLLSMLVGALWP